MESRAGPRSTQLGWIRTAVQITSLPRFHCGDDFQVCASPQLETLSCSFSLGIGTRNPSNTWNQTCAFASCLPPTSYTGLHLHHYRSSQVQWRVESAREQTNVHIEGTGILASCLSGEAEAPWSLWWRLSFWLWESRLDFSGHWPLHPQNDKLREKLKCLYRV